MSKSSLERRADATPRVQFRKGNLYWEPSAALRRAGFASQALGPLSVAALNRADELNAEADAERERRRRGAEREARPAALTMGAIFGLYRESPYFTDKAETTRRHYRAHMRTLEDHFGPELAAALTPAAVEDWLHAFSRTSGERNAHNVYRTLRLICQWAVRRGHMTTNPAVKIGAATPKARRRIATRAELRALIDAADALGRPSIGDFCVVAVCTMQRVSDVLALDASDHHEDGALHFTQSKTGKALSFAVHPEITARLGPLALRPGPLIVSEETGRGYGYDNFAHWFAKVRAAAGARCPSILGKSRTRDANYQGVLQAEDFRRTGMVWATWGGADLPSVVSVSGHEIERGLKILEVYLPRERVLADRALAALDLSDSDERRRA